MKRIKCCDCGTVLVCCDTDAETKLSLCLSCWQRLPQSVIVQRSREHETVAHAND